MTVFQFKAKWWREIFGFLKLSKSRCEMGKIRRVWKKTDESKNERFTRRSDASRTAIRWTWRREALPEGPQVETNERSALLWCRDRLLSPREKCARSLERMYNLHGREISRMPGGPRSTWRRRGEGRLARRRAVRRFFGRVLSSPCAATLLFFLFS